MHAFKWCAHTHMHPWLWQTVDTACHNLDCFNIDTHTPTEFRYQVSQKIRISNTIPQFNWGTPDSIGAHPDSIGVHLPDWVHKCINSRVALGAKVAAALPVSPEESRIIYKDYVVWSDVLQHRVQLDDCGQI